MKMCFVYRLRSELNKKDHQSTVEIHCHQCYKDNRIVVVDLVVVMHTFSI